MLQDYTHLSTETQGQKHPISATYVEWGRGACGEKVQDRKTIRTVEFGGLAELAEWYQAQGAYGTKGAPGTPALIPGVSRAHGSSRKRDLTGGDLGWADNDGCLLLASSEARDALLEWFLAQGAEAYAISSSSHDPEHPTTPQWRYRVLWRWSQWLQPHDYRQATLGLLVSLAEDVLGLQLPGGERQAIEALRALGLDPGVAEISHPLTVARWGQVYGSEEDRADAKRRKAAAFGVGVRPDTVTDHVTDSVTDADGEAIIIPQITGYLSAPYTLDPRPCIARWRAKRNQWSPGATVGAAPSGATPRNVAPGHISLNRKPSGATVDPTPPADLTQGLVAITGPLHPGCGTSDYSLHLAARALWTWRPDATEAEQCSALSCAYPGYSPAVLRHKVRSARRYARGRRYGSSTAYATLQRYFGRPDFSTSKILLRRGGCGTGKTTSAAAYADEVRAAGGEVAVITHRRLLTRAASEKMSLPNYQDAKGTIEGSVSICVDSIQRISPATKYALVVLDESEQLIRHIFSEEKIASGEAVYLVLELLRILREAKEILCSDADMGPLTRALLRMAYPDVTPKTEDLTGMNKKEIFVAPPGELGLRFFEDQLHRMLEARTKPVLLGVSHRAQAKEYYQRVIAEGWAKPEEILVVHGGNSTGLPQTAFAKDPDGEFARKKYRLVIYTSALGTGVDISRTDCHVLLHARAGGPLTHDLGQMLSRCRPSKKALIFIEGTPTIPEEHRDPEVHRRALRSRDVASRKIAKALAVEIAENRWEIPPEMEGLYCLIRAVEAEASYISPRYDDQGQRIHDGGLVRHLEAHGHSLTFLLAHQKAVDELDQRLPEAKAKASRTAVAQAVKAEQINAIESAPDHTEEEIEEIKKLCPTEAREAVLEKHYMARFYGRSPDADLIRKDLSGYRSECRAHAHLSLATSGQLHILASKDARELSAATPGHCRHRALRTTKTLEILRLLGVQDHLDTAIFAHPSPAAEDRIRTIAWQIWGLDSQRRLGLWDLIGRTLKKSGVKTKSKKIRHQNKILRVYHIDPCYTDQILLDSATYTDRLRGQAPQAPQAVPDYPALDPDTFAVLPPECPRVYRMPSAWDTTTTTTTTQKTKSILARDDEGTEYLMVYTGPNPTPEQIAEEISRIKASGRKAYSWEHEDGAHTYVFADSLPPSPTPEQIEEAANHIRSQRVSAL